MHICGLRTDIYKAGRACGDAMVKLTLNSLSDLLADRKCRGNWFPNPIVIPAVRRE